MHNLLCLYTYIHTERGRYCTSDSAGGYYREEEKEKGINNSKKAMHFYMKII
jgi:hypothetical protein